MFIDLLSPTAWDDLNDKLQKSWGLNERLLCFCGSRHALYEITRSLSQFMTHKKSVGMITGLSPLFHDQLPLYARDGIEVTKRSYKDPSSLSEWVESLNKDTNFVVFAADHPITGELFAGADELETLLTSKRIFSVKIHHRPRQIQDRACGPYSVHIHAYEVGRAVALLGARYRAPHLAAHLMSWNPKEFLDLKIEIAREDKEAVLAFEANFPQSSRVLLPGESRVFDRAVVVFEGVNADALLGKVSRLLPPELQAEMFTSNPCRWGLSRLFQTWWEPSPSNEVLSGLCVFSLNVLNTKNFANLLKTSYEELQAEQSWVV